MKEVRNSMLLYELTKQEHVLTTIANLKPCNKIDTKATFRVGILFKGAI